MWVSRKYLGTHYKWNILHIFSWHNDPVSTFGQKELNYWTPTPETPNHSNRHCLSHEKYFRVEKLNIAKLVIEYTTLIEELSGKVAQPYQSLMSFLREQGCSCATPLLRSSTGRHKGQKHASSVVTVMLLSVIELFWCSGVHVDLHWTGYDATMVLLS